MDYTVGVKKYFFYKKHKVKGHKFEGIRCILELAEGGQLHVYGGTIKVYPDVLQAIVQAKYDAMKQPSQQPVEYYDPPPLPKYKPAPEPEPLDPRLIEAQRRANARIRGISDTANQHFEAGPGVQ